MRSIDKCLAISLIISFTILFNKCETKERFYRPDLPQKLCTVGIIDIDDTITYNACMGDLPVDSMIYARKIYFEKSFQSEYPEEMYDSLRGLSFKISNDTKDIYAYKSKPVTKNLEIIIPESVKFEPGRKYFFQASEKETSDISAEMTLPELPPELSLISLRTGIMMLNPPKEECYSAFLKYSRRTAEIEFSFPNDGSTTYYAILLSGSHSDTRVDWSHGWGSFLMNFSVLEGNTTGFLFPIHGRKTIGKYCRQYYNINSYGTFCRQKPLYAYFIDGGKILGEYCTLKISAQWDVVDSPYDFIKCLRIRLMAIPKEAYLFYKSLYTYNRVSDDPFSDAVNISGNISGGNGLITICRSRELIVRTGQRGGIYDTFF
jgi:hypothetical protein